MLASVTIPFSDSSCSWARSPLSSLSSALKRLAGTSPSCPLAALNPKTVVPIHRMAENLHHSYPASAHHANRAGKPPSIARAIAENKAASHARSTIANARIFPKVIARFFTCPLRIVDAFFEESAPRLAFALGAGTSLLSTLPASFLQKKTHAPSLPRFVFVATLRGRLFDVGSAMVAPKGLILYDMSSPSI